MAQGLFTGGARACRGCGNRGAGTGVPAPAGRKLFSSAFTPHGSKEKISGSNFKKQAINFLPLENPFENRPEKADK